MIDVEAVVHPVCDAAAAHVAAKINPCRPAVDKPSFRPHHAVDARARRDRIDEHLRLNARTSKVSQKTELAVAAVVQTHRTRDDAALSVQTECSLEDRKSVV